MQGKAARDILIKLEKWLHLGSIPRLLQSISQLKLDEAISFVEDLIDNIDDHNEEVSSRKDIVTVPKARYEECFPESAEAFDTIATIPETVTNPQFDQIPLLLQKASDRKPVVITSVRKSTTTGRLQFGKQYVVDSANEEGVQIHYEHEGSGDLPIPTEVVDNLFRLRGALNNRKVEITQELAEVCQR